MRADLRGKISRDRGRKHLRVDVEVALVVGMNSVAAFGRRAGFGQRRQRLSDVGRERGDINQRRNLGIVPCLRDDDPTP